RHLLYFSVRYMDHSAVEVTQRGHAEADILNKSANTIEVHHITDAVLVFEDDKKPGNHIADQVLAAKTHSETNDTGTGKNRPYGYSNLLKNHKCSEQGYQNAYNPSKDPDEGVFPFAFSGRRQKTVCGYNFSDDP